MTLQGLRCPQHHPLSPLNLRPGVHGLILQQGTRRATYLPSVWDKLPQPEQFLSELRAKAGLPRHGWSDEIQVSVYTTEELA